MGLFSKREAKPPTPTTAQPPPPIDPQERKRLEAHKRRQRSLAEYKKDHERLIGMSPPHTLPLSEKAKWIMDRSRRSQDAAEHRLAREEALLDEALCATGNEICSALGVIGKSGDGIPYHIYVDEEGVWRGKHQSSHMEGNRYSKITSSDFSVYYIPLRNLLAPLLDVPHVDPWTEGTLKISLLDTRLKVLDFNWRSDWTLIEDWYIARTLE